MGSERICRKIVQGGYMNKDTKKIEEGNNLPGFRIRDVVILGIVLIGLIVLVVIYQEAHVGSIVNSRQLNQSQEKIVLCKKTIETAFESREALLSLSSSLLADKDNILLNDNCRALQALVSDNKWEDGFIIVSSGSYITAEGKSGSMNIGPYYKAIALEREEIVADLVDYNQDGQDELVLMVPIINSENKVEGLLCGIINSDYFKEEIKRFAEEGIHYYITNINGIVLGEYCLNPKEELPEIENLFEHIKSYGKDSNFITNLQREMENGVSGILLLEGDGTNRSFAYAPVTGTGLYLYMTFNEVEVYEIGKIVKQSYNTLLWDVMVVFSIFVAAVVFLHMLDKRRAKEQVDELKQLAEIDALTSAYNKAATVKYIKEHIESMEPGEQCALFIVDVDNFKMINDTKGHAFGDLVLKELGNGIRSEFRVTDIIGRIGGDEFIVFLKNINGSEKFMRRQGEKLVNFFHNLRPGEYVKTKVSASIGGAVCPTDAIDYQSLYEAADKALYLAKRRGKDQYALYQETLKTEEEK